MSMRSAPTPRPLAANWPLPASATLCSSVRTKRIEREIRARLPLAVRKCVVVEAGNVAMQMDESERDQFEAASAKISGGSRNLVGGADSSQDLRPKGSI